MVNITDMWCLGVVKWSQMGYSVIYICLLQISVWPFDFSGDGL